MFGRLTSASIPLKCALPIDVIRHLEWKRKEGKKEEKGKERITNVKYNLLVAFDPSSSG